MTNTEKIKINKKIWIDVLFIKKVLYICITKQNRHENIKIQH